MPECADHPMTSETVDLFIIGGGVNGCGIARDAAGRGLSVALAEMGDLASATSSASTKMFHGGLRYLEFFEFRLVREALAEREVLLQAMPHISWPMRFVLPLDPEMRFDGDTPAGRLLSVLMPWRKGSRPAWMIRLGLFLYDHIGGRRLLPGTRKVDLRRDPAGAMLRPTLTRAFEYSDCWVQDSRLVVLNARDAARRGARIMTRTRVEAAVRRGDLWHITLRDGDGARQMQARALVNAAGPWAGDVLRDALGQPRAAGIRLVRGSHIVTRRLYDHDRAYFLQGPDGRVVFVIPYEDDFTLIGTTEADHPDPDTTPRCSEAERRYLLDFVSASFAAPLTEADIVWTYAGVRALHEDGSGSATATSRDYDLALQQDGGAPLLTVSGGKITTYRRLAEAALARLAPAFPGLPGDWTAGVALPGGDFPVDGAGDLAKALLAEYPFLTPDWARRLVRSYGTDSRALLGGARSAADLGGDFGATISGAELAWAMDREWVRSGEDFLWRRTRLGLRLSQTEARAIDAHIAARLAHP
jgi:glycerol-3-phosphate dehydrogenase